MFKKTEEEKIRTAGDMQANGNNDNGIKTQIDKEFDLIDEYIRKAQFFSQWARKIITEKDTTSVYAKDNINKLSDNLRLAIQKTSDITFLLWFKRNDTSSIVKQDLKFWWEGEHLHIEFPSLLPRRIQLRSSFTQVDIRKMYLPSFEEYFKGKHLIYNQKAVIIFTHFFNSEKSLIDHDNFETKVVTDLITSYVFRDDSPKNCAVYMDYRMGEKSHTEIDVVPFEHLKDFL
jgi:hypothetical protein